MTLAFCSIQYPFIIDIRAKFGILNSSQSPNIIQNSDGAISDFRISGQSFINENCHNSRTSNNMDMKLGPLTKLDQKKNNTATSKKIDDDIMEANFDVTYFFLICGQFAAIWNPNIGAWSIKLTSFIKNSLLSYKN